MKAYEATGKQQSRGRSKPATRRSSFNRVVPSVSSQGKSSRTLCPPSSFISRSAQPCSSAPSGLKILVQGPVNNLPTKGYVSIRHRLLLALLITIVCNGRATTVVCQLLSLAGREGKMRCRSMTPMYPRRALGFHLTEPNRGALALMHIACVLYSCKSLCLF